MLVFDGLYEFLESTSGCSRTKNLSPASQSACSRPPTSFFEHRLLRDVQKKASARCTLAMEASKPFLSSQASDADQVPETIATW
jgi:hypothetical protein